MATQVKKTNATTATKEFAEEKEIIKETKVEDTKEIETLKKEIEDKDKKYEELNANFQKLQAQFETFMQMSMAKQTATSSADDDEEILVGCRDVYGSVLATNDGRYSFKFECDEEKYIALSDLKEVLKENGLRNNKRLFERDVFYFVNPADYKKFNIKKRIDLSHDNLVRILNLPELDMIDEVNKMTNHLIDFAATHSLQFEIVKMLIDKTNPLRDWRYENRHALERYIGQKFDDLQAAIGAVELLGRKKFSN